MSPLSNAYLTADKLNTMEPFYPLHTYVCSECFLVQLEEFESPEEIFGDYAYFSSYSESWLRHAEAYADKMLGLIELGKESTVIELASNDGYLLRYFKQRGIPVLGVEPAANVAKEAIRKGIPTEIVFFGSDSAANLVSEGHTADLLVGNNVLAHVPNLNDFVTGMKIILKPDGIITMEFPHLLELMKGNQFDTIYHEHFSYFSLMTVEKVFSSQGLRLFDVERLPTHGGSIRIFACHAGDSRPVNTRVESLKAIELEAGLNNIDTYRSFSEQVREAKRKILEFLIRAGREGKKIVGYGAPAKGNTLLNYCGIRTDFIEFTVDRSPHKQGRFLPGSHIPILVPEAILERKPDYILILPWNIKDEIVQQLSHVAQWGGKFVVPIPELRVLP